MTRTTKDVAFDVHQATTVTSVRKESGRVLSRSVLETHGPSIVEFLRGMRGAIHVAFEEGTQAQWLHDLIAPLVHRVVVCDRRGQPKAREQGRSGRCGPAVGAAAPGRADLKELTRSYIAPARQ